MIVITDIHGCYNTLRRLLAKCPDEQPVFLGDLVDRGPDSASVVRFAMDQKVPTVLGNHEWMVADAVRGGPMQFPWLRNGGGACLQSFKGVVPPEVADWIDALPLFLRYDDLLLSHTGHGLGHDRELAVWNRELRFPDDGLFRLFGHTPQEEILKLPNAWCIDTGAAYGGKLTAVQWPSLSVFEQPYDESPL